MAEFEAGTEVGVARIEHDEQAGPADLGLRLGGAAPDSRDPGGYCPGAGDDRR